MIYEVRVPIGGRLVSAVASAVPPARLPLWEPGGKAGAWILIYSSRVDAARAYVAMRRIEAYERERGRYE